MIFLLGAGASIPAGLKDIGQLTQEFEKYLGEEKEAYDYVKRTLGKRFERVDLEHILQQLDESVLGTRETSYLFRGEIEKEFERHQPRFPVLREKIKTFFRKELEVDVNTEYLIGLKGFVEEGDEKLDIFTLNYDSVVETFCEKEGIEYTDGFELGWNPSSFDNRKGIHLYKLHGSLYWFRTDDGKLVKIPIKQLHRLITNDVPIMYYTGERISESMIYPAAVKELEETPYSYLREQMKTKLLETDLLVVVGYSFRDEKILSLVQEQMKKNADLWMAVVDLHPKEVKERICENNKNLLDRTVSLGIDAGQAFGLRILRGKVDTLIRAYRSEKSYLGEISRSSTYETVESDLVRTIHDYSQIEHFSRIKFLAEGLLSTEFTDFKGPSPVLVENLFDLSLRFGLECCIQKDWKYAELWFQIFGGPSIHTEYHLVAKFSSNAGAGYLETWRKLGKSDIPWRVNYGSGRTWLSKSNLEKVISLGSLLETVKEPEIIANIKSIVDSVNSLIRVYGAQHLYSEYIRDIQNGKMGLIYSVPKLIECISSKFNRSESLVRKWDSDKIC